ncbi:MAG: hypothetical protein ABI823_07615 [Bryobacteraceae bacterium]
MALYTDGSPSTIEDLRGYESSLLDVARVEQIDLDGKLALAAGEVGDELIAFLLRRPSQDPQAANRRQMGLSTVVVTDGVKRWHTLHTLATVFSDAFSSQLNDRFRNKYEQYAAFAQTAKQRAFEYGVGVVETAVPRASTPVCSSGAGTEAATNYYVSASWIGAGEGAASFPTTYETAAGSTLAVAVAAVPSGVTGWNVYAGLTRESMARQNSSPLAIGATWLLPPGGLTPGAPPSQGQDADVWVAGQRTLIRG